MPRSHFRFLLALFTTLFIVRASHADTAVIPTDPAKFELYLLVGQSNMAGRGAVTDEDRKPDPHVLVFNKEDTWALQGEPIHFDKPIAGVGLGFTFAKLMAEKKPGVTIGLIPCAVGGTPLARWKPGGDLYKEALRRAKLAMKSGTLKGILWHQGESDSGREDVAKQYGDGLLKVIEGFRKDLEAPQVPFVAGELGEFVKAPYASVVNEQINSLPPRTAKMGVASSKGLTHRGDSLHFNSESLKEFAHRYFDVYMKLEK